MKHLVGFVGKMCLTNYHMLHLLQKRAVLSTSDVYYTSLQTCFLNMKLFLLFGIKLYVDVVLKKFR